MGQYCFNFCINLFIENLIIARDSSILTIVGLRVETLWKEKEITGKHSEVFARSSKLLGCLCTFRWRLDFVESP